MKDAFVLCGTARPANGEPLAAEQCHPEGVSPGVPVTLTSFCFKKAACAVACTRLPVCVDRPGRILAPPPPPCLASCVSRGVFPRRRLAGERQGGVVFMKKA